MKNILYVVSLASALLIAGCATSFRPWNLSQVQEGMDRAQVVKILGEPDFAETLNGADHLHYRYQEDVNPTGQTDPLYNENADLKFQDLDNERIFKQYEYVVVLTDGKVTNCKKIPAE